MATYYLKVSMMLYVVADLAGNVDSCQDLEDVKSLLKTVFAHLAQELKVPIDKCILKKRRWISKEMPSV